MPRQKNTPKKLAGKTFVPTKYHRKKLKVKSTTPKQTLHKVQSAIVIALNLLKPVVNKKIPSAHFNFEPKNESSKEEKEDK